MEKELVLDLMKDQMGLASELVRQQVAGMIFAALLMRVNMSSVADMANDGDMEMSNLAAVLSGMVCDACEGV